MSSEVVKVAPYISWNRVEGELALFDMRDGRYHLLNRSSAEIWRGLDERTPLETLAQQLAARHNVSEEVIAESVRDFISVSLDNGLLINDSDRK
jgi:hypothetical protein